MNGLVAVEAFDFSPEGKMKAERLAKTLKDKSVKALVWVRFPMLGRPGLYRVAVPQQHQEGVLVYIAREKAEARQKDEQK